MEDPFFDFLYDYDFFGLLETEEIKRKREELREAKKKAYEQQMQEYEKQIQKREERPLPVLLAESEEKFRNLLEKYAKEHPKEKVTGIAMDRPNFIYRSMRIVKKE